MTRRDRLLWAAAAVGPTAWFVDLVVSYALAPSTPHVRGGLGRLHLVSLAAFAITAVALVVAVVEMRRVPVKEEETHDPSLQRARFLALSAVVLCLFSLLLIAGLEIPNWLVTAGAEP